MSRTDNQKPGWVRSTYWKPQHNACQHATWRTGYRECDLPDRPVRRRPERRRWRPDAEVHCEWLPCWDFGHRSTGGRRGEWVRFEWNGPIRARVRDECRTAVAEYRGSGEVDIMPNVDQHRHSVCWDRW